MESPKYIKVSTPIDDDDEHQHANSSPILNAWNDLPRSSESQMDQFEVQSISSLDIIQDDEKGKSNMKMAFMNMANSILGAGIIGQPFAFRNSGLIGGCIVLLVLTMLIDWTLRLIVRNAKLANANSYQDFVAHCFGKPGRILLLFAVGSFAYGGCMAFCVIIGDTIPHVLRAFIPKSITESTAVGWLFKRNVIITLFTTCISYPLSLNRDISKLAKASGFALVGMLIIVIITAVRGPMVDSSLKTPLTTLQWTVNYNIFQGISVISFALVCHHNTVFIYNSLKVSVKQRFGTLTHAVCFVSMICCLVMAVSGLLNFGGATKGNILNNFKSNDNWINVARFCFGLNMLTTFPLEIFVVRDVVRDIISSVSNDTDNTHFELTSKQHFFITTILVVSTMSVALFTCNLGIILELIGATSASLMAYIIPPLCFLKLKHDQRDFKLLDSAKKKRFHIYITLPTVACASFGLLVLVVSSFMSIRSAIHGGSGDHCVVD